MMAKRKLKPSPGTVARSSIALSISELAKDYIYRIDLDADYQREKVWTARQQEELLDSIVKGIDIPKLYLAEVRNNKNFDYECIDGKQRLLTISTFLNPDDAAPPLKIELLGQKYTYQELVESHPTIAKIIDNYVLDFVVYDEKNLTDSFIREIFRRLQLGVRLNSGEILNSQMGAMRDFVFKRIGIDGPFVRNSGLSDKRYSKQFTVAQVCINSFHRARFGEFCRARLTDLEDFFADNATLSSNDENFVRIRNVLQCMDDGFAENATAISSRAVAVSAYLVSEELFQNDESALVANFAIFLSKLLSNIKADMKLVSEFKKPKSPTVLENFQKYILQASVEPYSIRRRHEFLLNAFKDDRRKANKRQRRKT